MHLCGGITNEGDGQQRAGYCGLREVLIEGAMQQILVGSQAIHILAYLLAGRHDSCLASPYLQGP